MLQCGDPTGTGTGGPGYRFPNEYPTNQYRLTDPRMGQPVEYPRGTLAMANSGPGTNGSQFFLVYKDSMLPPTYTVFGTIDAAGLAVVDKVAAGGVQGGTDDGKPTTSVNIQSVTVKYETPIGRVFVARRSSGDGSMPGVATKKPQEAVQTIALSRTGCPPVCAATTTPSHRTSSSCSARPATWPSAS